MVLQKHVGHVHHERRLHRLMMKDELRVFEIEHAHLVNPQAGLGPGDSALTTTSDMRHSSSGTLTTATLAASRSMMGSMPLSSASLGVGNNSGRSARDEELPNVHVTLASAIPSQVCLRCLQQLSMHFRVCSR